MAEKILQRIDGIIKQIDFVQNKMEGISFDEFQKRDLLPEAISFAVSQVGERMTKLEELLVGLYPDLPWKEARKMRNIIIHNYDGVDFKEVYSTAVKDLPILRQSLLKIKNDIKHINDNAIATDRLLLRPWDDLDADELLELAKEPEIGYWCGFKPHQTINDTLFVLHNILETKETYAICLKENQKVIGSISLQLDDEKKDECELGFWIGKPFWNNGYLTEAANRLIKHAFENLHMSIIWCGYFEGNERSKRVQEKLGFAFHHIEHDVFLPQLDTKRTRIVNRLKA